MTWRRAAQMTTPAAAYRQEPGAAALLSRVCAVKTMCTAAQPGLSVTQRRVPVNRKAVSCPGWSRPQPASARQTPKPWRGMSLVIMSPAAPPPLPAADSRLENGAAVLPQRLSAARTTSTVVLRATRAWLGVSVRGGTRSWRDWGRCLPPGLPCPNPKTPTVTSTPAAQWGRPAAQA